MRYIALSVVFLLITAGCSLSAETSQDEPIRIGGAFALTGWADAWGEEDLRGATIAVEEINAQGGINGRLVKLHVQDTTSSNEGTFTAVRSLIDIYAVDGIIGPTWLETYGSATALSDEGLIMVTPSGVIEAVQLSLYHPYIYSTWYSFEEELVFLLEHLAAEGHTSVAMLLGLTPYWQAVSLIVNREAENYGITVVKEFASDDEVDYRTLLLQIAAVSPDVILFGMDDEHDMFSFVKQHKELAIQAPLVGQEYLLSFATDPAFSKQFEGVQIVSPVARDSEFMQEYMLRYGSFPQLSASNAYDATHILVEAIGNTDGSPSAVQHYLNTNTFTTETYGRTRFGGNGGIRSGDFAVYEIISGKAVLLS